MKFKLHCVQLDAPTHSKYFLYDNQTGLLREWDDKATDGVQIGSTRAAFQPNLSANPIRKHNAPRILKIQLGLHCNLSCSYCLQKSVLHADVVQTNTVTRFVEKIRNFLCGSPENIQLWGGEPLVYVKTLKPLVGSLKSLYPNAKLTMVTNGSLLTEEINDWIISNCIGISISHDGPGQRFRGPDPLDDPAKAAAIFDLYRRKKAAGDPVSIGAMIHAQNQDRAEIAAWFREKFQDADIDIGEGALIDVYDDTAKANCPQTHLEQIALRLIAFRNIRYGADQNFSISRLRMDEWLSTLQKGRMLDELGMKCGMDREDTLTIDLLGNVVTCQNTSIATTAPNGESHNGGNIEDFSSVRITTAKHFMHRAACQQCPVVQTCKGGCMFLDGDLFEISCENAYTDHIPYFANAVEILTGYVPIYIEDEAHLLPEGRRDIFGYGRPAVCAE